MSRVLYLATGHVRGTGGEAISERNRRWLETIYGAKSFRALELRWYVFDPLRFRKTPGLKLRALVWRLISTLIWWWTFVWYRPLLVFVDGSSIHVPNFRFLGRVRTVVFYHNVEQDYYAQAHSDYTPIVADTESRFTRGAAACICLNARDSNRLLVLYGRGADFIMPTTLIDHGSSSCGSANEGFLLFVGTDFFGNTDGLFWFIENCLSRIGMRLVVVGSGMARYRGKYVDLETRGLLEFRGFVEDIGAVYRAARAVVLPITSGSGMKTKTAEALMYDKVIYGTDEAFEGYEGVDAVAVRCRTAEDFVRTLRSDVGSSKHGARDYFLSHCEDGVGFARFKEWIS